MKWITKRFMVAMIFAAVFCGCGPTAKDILNEYESYVEVPGEADESHVYFEVQEGLLMVKYSLPLLNSNEKYVKMLADRWFVADATNPDLRLPANVGIMTIDSTANGMPQPVSYGNSIDISDLKEQFLLIGFEGISSSESKEAEIPLQFFLVEKKKGMATVLTTTPRMAGELFVAGYQPMFFSEQEYSGEIPFEKSKDVMMHLTLSADLKQVTKLQLTVGKMILTPANFNKQRKKSDKASIFKYLENSAVRENIAIQNIGGFNVPARDASGGFVVSDMEFTGGGFEITSPIDITDGKIVLDERPLICDLTVTNACVYGTIKVETSGCGTQAMYAVFKNRTTPQDIPEDVLNKSL